MTSNMYSILQDTENSLKFFYSFVVFDHLDENLSFNLQETPQYMM